MRFALPAELEAHEPPEARGLARDGVRMLVSRSVTGTVTQHAFGELPDLLLPGDLLVVNTSRTLPAAVLAALDLAVHFSTQLPDGTRLVELRRVTGKSTAPAGEGVPGQVIGLPGGVSLTLLTRWGARLWRARLSVAVVPYLRRHGMPVSYSYVPERWPLSAYQTVFGQVPGSAEMPGAGRPFTAEMVTTLVSRGVAIAPVTLHCGVSSLEADEDPYPEQFEVPPATARLVNLTRQAGGRVIAVGTTAVRALESAAAQDGAVSAAAGFTSHVVTGKTGVRCVDGLLTGLHEPRSSHLRMLAAFHDEALLTRCYAKAIAERYLWHEFGDVHLLLT
jgi:S-adenosylmethionine:tRNA ribosyltransferase-isomerase